jgi:hypothetical protein
MGLALFVGLALLSTPARATVQVFDGGGNLQPGSTATLDQLVNHGWFIDINNGVDIKEFKNFSNFSSTNLGVGQVNVTGNDAPGPNPLQPGPGITISGPFIAAAGTNQDTSFNYQVTVKTGTALITDIHLSALGVVPVGGMITVTETASVGGQAVGVSTLQVPPPGNSKTMDMALVPGTTSVNIHKDILIQGGSFERTALTDIAQNFSQSVVPEPSTMAIAALGALGFIGYGLRRRLQK